jgi:NAD(P)-dependent dehydrogenase (short-subunit alcohol dehydrogenase family)
MLVDLRDEAAIACAVEAAGRIDVLVNNAGYGLTGAIEETSRQDAQDLFAINVLAPLADPRGFARHARAGRAISSTSPRSAAMRHGRARACMGPASSRWNVSGTPWPRKWRIWALA